MDFQQEQARHDPVGSRIANRFTVEAVLGHGGMGAVYRALDESSGKRVALKRLHVPNETHRDTLISLFEREFHTLAQLVHPRVIEVFDYGVDALGPYYTMELLEGTDLKAAAPIPWRRACALLRDVASCLAMLHSRRLVHHDVTPGNVRVVSEEHAKLIDFGAMMPMGVAKDVVGTAQFMSPETLYRQPLDGRSDLFSLGAVLYFALTRRDAYPARGLGDLPKIWKQPLRAPSEADSDIPPALDELVLGLLAIDPQARPASAAEVIERLQAIAELPRDESSDVARAYLSTPDLVAREETLEAFRSALRRTRKGRGGALLVEASAGMGRSRVLDTFGLNAKLSGVVVLRAGLEDAAHGAFGMARAWVGDLLRTIPDAAVRSAAPYGQTLGQLFPALREAIGSQSSESGEDPVELTLRAHGDFVAWLEDLSREQTIVVLLDDLHEADAESAALVAALAQAASSSNRLIAVTTDLAGPASEAQQLVREVATVLPLAPLTAEDMAALLRSIFGQAPRLELLSAWIHRQSEGSPQLCMELAQFLWETQKVRYEGGAWILPEDPESLRVPDSLERLLAERLATLSSDARVLAETRALVTRDAPLEVREYLELLPGEASTPRAHAAVAELIAAQIWLATDRGYVFRQSTAASLLDRELSPDARRERHRALATVYDRRESSPLILAHHLQEAGEGAQALDRILPRMDFGLRTRLTDLSATVGSSIEAALAEAKRQGRPRHEQVMLLMGLLVCAGSIAPKLIGHADELVEHLRRDTGLDLWSALDASMDPVERTRLALSRAQERYDRSPESDRGVPPSVAVQILSTSLTSLMSFCARARDAQRIYATAELLKPLVSVSPLAAFSYDLIVAAGRRTGGGDPLKCYPAILQRTKEGIPGHRTASELLETYRIIGYYVALGEVYSMASGARALAFAEELVRSPVHELLGWHVQLSYHLLRGDSLEAGRCRRRLELARMRNPTTHQHASSILSWELVGSIWLGDLMNIKRLLEPLEAEARDFPCWRPTAHQARAEYHWARSEAAAARRELEAGLALAGPGRSASWGGLVARCLEVMVAQGEAAAARARGREAVALGEAHDTEWVQLGWIRLATGLAEVAAGDTDAGLSRIDAVLAECRERTAVPVYLAFVQEKNARAALLASDAARFHEACLALGELARSCDLPVLDQRYQQLLDAGRRLLGGAVTLGAEERTALDEAYARVQTELDGARKAEIRIGRAIELIERESGARRGTLFGLREGEVELLGSRDPAAPTSELADLVTGFLSSESATLMKTSMMTTLRLAPEDWRVDGRSYRPVILDCSWKSEQSVAGVAVLECDPEAELEVPAELLSALAAYLADAGDTTPVSYLDL